jgi:hypothetical protein
VGSSPTGSTDYYYLKVKFLGEEYLIKKREDGWFYISYTKYGVRIFWECDQIEGVLELLKDEKVIK